MTELETPRDARLVGGVWLPAGEEHFTDWMQHSRKARTVEGKLTYQYHKLEAAVRLQPADRREVALDIGAHVGLWAMWLVRAFAHVHAFEPVPSLAGILPFNMDRANWTLHRTALGARTGTVAITVPEDVTGNAHVAVEGRHPGARYARTDAAETWLGVPMTTLDALAIAHVDFIKIDVEGYELPVVQGARETILRRRPNIVIEQKGNDSIYGDPKDAALAYLRALGMTPLEEVGGDWILGWPA